MIWFKGCPRCTGDLYRDKDQYGPFVTCAQCGFNKDVPTDGAGLLVISAEPVPAPEIPRWEGGKRRRISHGGRHFTRAVAVIEDPTAKTPACN